MEIESLFIIQHNTKHIVVMRLFEHHFRVLLVWLYRMHLWAERVFLECSEDK